MNDASRRPRPGPGTRASSPALSAEGNNFLQALGRKLQLRLAVYVSVELPTRALWSTPTGPEGALVRLEQRGREWLAADIEHASAPGQTDEVTVAPVRDRGGAALGVIVAAKQDGHPWTSDERALIGFAAEFYGPALDDRAAPLHPGSALPAGDPANDLETGMRTAAGNGELYLVYQPEVDLPSGQVVAVEALLRWLHPLRGALDPESFISLAEQSDLIKVLGAWVIEESMRELASWNDSIPGLDVSLRVNVSPVQIAIDDIVALFAGALESNRLSGEQVCVEITENVMPGDVAQLSRVLRALKKLGISSAIDDLATGYSTLSRLRSLPVDIVKIDRSLVSGVDHDLRARAIVTAIIGLARDLDVGVVAEGIETAAEAATLVELGCSRAQGHYFGRPMAAASMRSLLLERGRTSGN